MPIQNCRSGGRPGFKAGPTGKCFTYNKNSVQSRAKARARAEAQLRAIKASQSQEKK
jgi:hypothetical protein